MNTSAPPGWRLAKLSDVADIRLGKMLSAKARAEGLRQLPYLRNENVRWGRIDTSDVKLMGFTETELDRYQVRHGDLLVCEGGEPGRCAVYVGNSLVMYQKALHRVRCSPSVSPYFLAYWFRRFTSTRAVASRVSQTTIAHLPLEEMRELVLAIPSRKTQDEIVAEIEKHFTRLDAAVASLKQARAKLKAYRASVQWSVFLGRVAPEATGDVSQSAKALLGQASQRRRAEWEAQFIGGRRRGWKEPTEPDPTRWPVPGGWGVVSIGMIGRPVINAIKAGPFGSSIKKNSYVAAGYKVYGQEQVIRGDSTFGSYYISGEHFERLKSCAISPGDVLVSLVGTTGRVLVLPPDAEPGIINPRLIKISPDRSLIRPEYLKLYLEGPLARSFFAQKAHGQTMDVLNLSILSRLPILLPPPAVQDRIISELSLTASVSATIERTLAESLIRVGAMRRAILARAFAGQLVEAN